MSFTSFCRFTQPSRDTMTTLSSSMMKSSAVYSRFASASISVRRLSSFASPYGLLDLLRSRRARASSGSSSFFSSPLICHRALALLLELLLDDQNLEPGQAIDLQLEDRVGLFGVELEARMIFSAASALPSDLRTMRRISSSASKTFSKPSSRWMRFFSASSSCSSRARDDVEPEVQEVPEDLTADRAARAGRPRGSRSGSGTSGSPGS